MLTRRELDSIPDCLVGSVADAQTFDDAVWLARIELDLIEEGQEAAEAYSAKEVQQIRRFVKRHLKDA